MTRKSGLILLAALIVLVITGIAFAADWRTIETDHFFIHYQSGYEKVAQRASLIAEEIYPIGIGAVGHEPEEKTQIVLTDNTDAANGFTRSTLFNGMTLLMAPMSDGQALGSGFARKYDDWLYSLMLHEFVHVLHMDMNGGPAKVVRDSFGRVPILSSLNVMQSFAWVEGFAVYQESHLALGGRSGDPLFRMFLRSNVLADDFPHIDQVLGYYDLKEWKPAGNTYLYGSALIEYIAEAYGPEKIQEINQIHASQLFPGVDRAMRKVLGKGLIELWQECQEWIKETEGTVLAQRQQAGVVEGRRLTSSGERTMGPVFLPTGELAYRSSGRNSFPGVYLWAEDSQPALLFPDYSSLSARVGAFPDGQRLVYSKMFQESTEKMSNELIIYDRTSRTERRLTSGGRVIDPAVSPDGRVIAYVQIQPYRSRLVLMDLTSGETSAIPLPSAVEAVGGPVFSPDGTRIALGTWRKGGWQDIAIVDLQGQLTWVTADDAADLYPAWSPDGRYIYYASDLGGVYDLYAYQVSSGQQFQLTRVLSGAFQPAPSPDGKQLAYAGYSSEGYDIYLLKLDAALWELVDRKQQAYAPSLPTAVEADLTALETESKPYSPWAALKPKYYLLASFLNPGSAGVMVYTGGEDALRKHVYSLNAGWDIQEKRPLFGLVYTRNFADYGPSLKVEYDNFEGDQELTALLSYSTGGFTKYSGGVGAKVTKPEQSGQLETSLVYQAGVQGYQGRGKAALLTSVSLAGQEDLSFKGRAIVGRIESRLTLEQTPRLFGSVAAGYGDGHNFVVNSVGGSTFNVRGLEGEFSGDRVLTASIAWRPLDFRIERGYSDIPIFFSAFTVDLFVDGGASGWGRLDPAEYYGGIEAGLPIELIYGTGEIGYSAPTTLSLKAGYAAPLNGRDGGGFYLSANLPLLGF